MVKNYSIDALNCNEDAIKISSIINTDGIGSECLSKGLAIDIKEGKEVRKSIKLKNNSKSVWPKNCYIACIKDLSNIYGNNVYISIRIEMNKEINVEVVFQPNLEIESGKYLSCWQMHTPQNSPFGEVIIFEVNYEKKILSQTSKPILLEAVKNTNNTKKTDEFQQKDNNKWAKKEVEYKEKENKTNKFKFHYENDDCCD